MKVFVPPRTPSRRENTIVLCLLNFDELEEHVGISHSHPMKQEEARSDAVLAKPVASIDVRVAVYGRHESKALEEIDRIEISVGDVSHQSSEISVSPLEKEGSISDVTITHGLTGRILAQRTQRHMPEVDSDLKHVCSSERADNVGWKTNGQRGRRD